MESKKLKTGPVLLPMYCKKIGLAILLMGLIPAVVVKMMHVSLEPSHKEIFRVLSSNAFLLGLLIIAWSRDKVEDEMTIFIRLKSMAWTFSWTVLYVIIRPLIDLMFNDPVEIMKGQEVVMSMLFVYLIMYFFQKRGR